MSDMACIFWWIERFFGVDCAAVGFKNSQITPKALVVTFFLLYDGYYADMFGCFYFYGEKSVFLTLLILNIRRTDVCVYFN